MLKLFAGRENIDKERFIYDRVSERTGETFVLVPDQYTLVAEEQALDHLGTECLFDVEILSMNRLGLRVLTEQGRESVRMLDKYGRFMLLTLLIKEHASEFEVFARSAGKLTFTAMLSDFISEFKQQDCRLDDLRDMLSGEVEDPVFEAKLKELSGIMTAYEEAISGRYTDSEDYISMYTEAFGESELIKGKTFWIYGYDSVTPKFRDAVLKLADAGTVNFVVNRSDFDLDERVTSDLISHARESGIGVTTEEIDSSYALPVSETVSLIEKHLWKSVPDAASAEACREFAPEDLTMVCCANPYYEAESAAAYVWHLIRDLGYRMRDIQIIANDGNVMQPIIRRTFEECGLTVFADSARSITDSAPVAFIINLLCFVRDRGSTQRLFAMLKTGLSGFGDEDIEKLENYAREYRIKGSMWDRPFRYGADSVGEDFEALDGMRASLSESAAALKKAASSDTVAEFTFAFRAYLQDVWKLDEAVEKAAEAAEAEGLNDEAQRMTQSYGKALGLLDQIDEIMGESPMDLAEFTDIYTAGLADVEVGVIPPSVDGLSMGTMIRTRPRRMRAVVILGANDGVLPMDPATEGLFSVDERNYFREKGIALGNLESIKTEEEKAAMYRITSKPSEKIYISWSLSDADGNDAGPSSIVDSLTALFPRITADGMIQKDIVSRGWNDRLIQTAQSGMRHLVNHLKDRNADRDDELTRSLLKWYSDNDREELDVMLKAAAYDNSPAPLGHGLASQLFGRRDGTLTLSASSINSYFECPFRFFIDRGLRPGEERRFESDSRSVGDVYHECLMAVARRLMGERELMEKIKEGDDEELERLVSETLDELSANYRGGLYISAGSEKYRMSRIREICAGAARAMAVQLAADTVVDASFEDPFGRNGKFGPISFRSGEDEVYVEGRIDRTDYIDVDGERRVRIVDYKTGADSLDLEKMRQGFKMQLMIYLISASSDGTEPAGMFYFNIKDPIEGANGKSEKQMNTIMEKAPEDAFRLKGAFVNEEGVLAAMPEKVLSSSRGGVTREAFEEIKNDVLCRIEETAEGILAGKIGINPLKPGNRLVCSYCGYKSICRRDRGYVKNAARTVSTGSAKG